MELIDAKIDWNTPFATDPILCLLVDRVPLASELLYEERANALFGMLNGYVNFYYADPHDKNGYYGASTTLNINYVGQKTFVGLWSSRAGAMNALGFSPCVDCYFATNPSDFKINHFCASKAVMLEFAQEAIKLINNKTLASNDIIRERVFLCKHTIDTLGSTT